ncbi:hypothetical protein NDA16_003168 [Ustilago loliicola]|nr:hypothetical protein NDA16_003168 [Ustilago loliicola]
MSATQVLTRSRSRPSNAADDTHSIRRSSTHVTPATANATVSSAPLLENEYEDRRNLKLSVRLVDTIRHYWDLGFTAFGGPGVHVVILRKRFVEKLAWLDETTFADLFSLGNALPGPGSTQLAFSIAVARNGTLAGLVAFLFWSIPGAAGMAALGAGVRNFPERLPPIVLGLLTGLNAAAVGLIALAAFQLKSVSRKLNVRNRRMDNNNTVEHTQHDSTQDIELEQVNTAQSTSLDKAQTPASVQELPFQAGSSSARGSLRQRNAQTVDRTTDSVNASTNGTNAAVVDRRTPIMVLNRYFAIGLGAVFIVFIVAVVVTRSQLTNPPRALDFFTNMMIAGVIIFGGGPVVIPLLRGYTVENGWVDSRDFLLGFAILQAFPGPNFNFAAYLGVLSVPSNPALGAFIGWLGIFSPGILLKLSLLPIYNTWRKHEVAKSVLRGLNASATGLVYTAVWQLFLVGYIYTPARGAVVEATSQSGPLTSDPFWGVVASSAFVATQWFKSPPAVTIVAGAVAGLAWFGVVGAAGTERQQAFF